MTVSLLCVLHYRSVSFSQLEIRQCAPRPYPEEKALYKERSPINALDTWKTATAFFQVGLSDCAPETSAALSGCRMPRDRQKLCLDCQPSRDLRVGWTEEALAVQGDEDKIVPPNQVRSSLTSCHRSRNGDTHFEQFISCQIIMSDLTALSSPALPISCGQQSHRMHSGYCTCACAGSSHV